MNLDIKAVKKCQELKALLPELKAAFMAKGGYNLQHSAPIAECQLCIAEDPYRRCKHDIEDLQRAILVGLGCD